MNERTSHLSPVRKLSRTSDERSNVPYRRPFWLSVMAYYALAALIAAALFLFVWLILREGDEEFPAAVAAIAASSALGGAIILREIFLKKTRQRYLLVERKLGYPPDTFSGQIDRKKNTEKLTLEENARIVKEIKRKSSAAQDAKSPATVHWEVFETCDEYLSLVEKQMATVGVGSPRLAGLRRGREVVGKLHHFHLLAWAEIESRGWSQKVPVYATIADKINAAQEALNILNSALQFYPDEPRLTESESAVKSFIASIKVSHWIEQAERSAFKGSYKRAISLYRDALFFLARENVNAVEREAIAEKINSEIEKLREVSKSGKKVTKIKKGKADKGNEYSEMSEMP